MKKISILGSTGSIGCQTLEIVDETKELEIIGLTANTQIDKLEEQIRKYHPRLVAVMDIEKAKELNERVGHLTKVLSGMQGLIEVACAQEADIVVTAVVGMIGLQPTVAAIKAGKDIALANKETLVTAGELIMPLIEEYQVKLLPVDSEHSAIFQSLQGSKLESIESIILTASGGPFRGLREEALSNVTLEQALKHPNWSMGSKITIDSATMMNKGLEVIEAKWLFGLEPEQIQVVVHPQSIIHSMVEYVDGSNIAQLGLPDMKLPIQYALFYPDRKPTRYPRLKLDEIGSLTFEKPDYETFRCLQLAFDAMHLGGTYPTVLNAVNEWAVRKFIQKEISFTDISLYIEKVMKIHVREPLISVSQILEVEAWSYETAERLWQHE